MVKPIKRLQLGKHGLTSSFVEQVRILFEHEEVVKISILRSACRDKSHAKELAEELVSLLGKNFVFRLVGYVITVRKFRKHMR